MLMESLQIRKVNSLKMLHSPLTRTWNHKRNRKIKYEFGFSSVKLKREEKSCSQKST